MTRPDQTPPSWRFLALALVATTATSAHASEPWQTSRWFRPVVGVSSFATEAGTSTAVQLGGTLGVSYWKAPYLGRTRLRGTWLSSSDGGEGLDLRGGSFIGPRQEWWGAETGLDIFWNRYTWNGHVLLPESVGVDLPLFVLVGPDRLHGLAGVSTAWLANPDRRVDWSRQDTFGFGHEFAWHVGAGISLGSLGLAVTWSRRTLATGTQTGVGFSGSLHL